MNWYEDPVYIKMCERAEKIQELLLTKKLEIDDILLFYDKAKGIHYRITHVEDCAGSAFADVFLAKDTNSKIIWLPNQSQLQGMIEDVSPRKKAIRFAKWVEDLVGVYDWLMEQLWLAAIMNWKYGKVWDSEKEEWIKC